jgi:hypothetical protein
MIEMSRKMIKELPQNTERNYGLYQMFCDKVLSPLLFEPILFPKDIESLKEQLGIED